MALLLAIVSVWAVGAGDAFVTNPTRGGADGTSFADRFAELVEHRRAKMMRTERRHLTR